MTTPVSAFGPYKVVKHLDSGGFSDVYLAEDEDNGERVAVKCLQRRHRSSSHARERMGAEAALLMRLRHPNIVRVLNAGVNPGGAIWMAMEFLDGKTLRDELNTRKRLDLARALYIAGKVADGLAAAHTMRVVHRDLKPENIMLTAGNEVVVLDLGAAKFFDWGVQTTGDRPPTGTPMYMAPEHILGRPVDARADVYALGLILYEMCSMRHPLWMTPNDKPVRDAVPYLQIHATPTPLPECVPGFPVYLWEVVAKAIEKKPEKRFPTMDAFAAALRGAAARLLRESHNRAGPPTPPPADIVPPDAPASGPDAVVTAPDAVDSSRDAELCTLVSEALRSPRSDDELASAPTTEVNIPIRPRTDRLGASQRTASLNAPVAPPPPPLDASQKEYLRSLLVTAPLEMSPGFQPASARPRFLDEQADDEGREREAGAALRIHRKPRARTRAREQDLPREPEAAARPSLTREAAARPSLTREAAARPSLTREAAARPSLTREAAARPSLTREAARGLPMLFMGAALLALPVSLGWVRIPSLRPTPPLVAVPPTRLSIVFPQGVSSALSVPAATAAGAPSPVPATIPVHTPVDAKPEEQPSTPKIAARPGAKGAQGAPPTKRPSPTASPIRLKPIFE